MVSSSPAAVAAAAAADSVCGKRWRCAAHSVTVPVTRPPTSSAAATFSDDERQPQDLPDPDVVTQIVYHHPPK